MWPPKAALTMASLSLIDLDRSWWLAATSLTGGVGLVAMAVPFVASLEPSERAGALGGPIEVQLQAIQPGERKTVDRRGKPRYATYTTAQTLR